MGGRFDIHDQFRELRLDVDNMSYEVRSFPSCSFLLQCDTHTSLNRSCLSSVKGLGMSVLG